MSSSCVVMMIEGAVLMPAFSSVPRSAASPTCITRIGRKTKRIEMPNYYADEICQDYADWMLKEYSAVTREITVTCTQMFHIVENQVITVERADKPGSPVERHVIRGFTRPVGQTGTMSINCVSVKDIPDTMAGYTVFFTAAEIYSAEGNA